MYKQKHLSSCYLKTGPHTDAHPRETDPNGLYSALQPWRIVWLGVRMAGYLAASARLDVHNSPELQSPEDGPGQPDADQRQRQDEARPASSRPDQRREMRSENQTSASEMRSEAATGRDQRTRSSDTRPAAADTASSRLSLFSLVQTTTLSSQAGGASFPLWPLASSLVGLIARFPGRPPLGRPMVGGATPTFLGGVRSGGVCGSAHLLTSGHVRNGVGSRKRGEGVLLLSLM